MPSTRAGKCHRCARPTMRLRWTRPGWVSMRWSPTSSPEPGQGRTPDVLPSRVVDSGVGFVAVVADQGAGARKPPARRLRTRAVAPFDDGHPDHRLPDQAAVALH